jgi:hypothetical protein
MVVMLSNGVCNLCGPSFSYLAIHGSSSHLPLSLHPRCMADRAPLNLSSPMEDVVSTVANFSEFEA